MQFSSAAVSFTMLLPGRRATQKNNPEAESASSPARLGRGENFMALPRIPDSSDKPRSTLDKIYTSTPVVLTVIATVLAGLSSGELTRAQYFRTFAAQFQSKASDQWAYFQAKRMRSVEAQNTLDLLSAAARVSVATPAALLTASQKLVAQAGAAPATASAANPASAADTGDASPTAAALDAQLRTILGSGGEGNPFANVDAKVPKVVDAPIADAKVAQAMDAVTKGQSDEQLAPMLLQIRPEALDDALQTAAHNLDAFDGAIQSASDTLDALHKLLAEEASIANGMTRATPAGSSDNGEGVAAMIQAVQADIDAARLRFAVARYAAEANYNGVSAQIYEVQVRQNGAISDRHRVRSTDFFYGMLAAQAGVTIATLGLAVRDRSLFWSLATLAGAAAIAFSGYIYLYT
jgi:hypothetical protein